MEITIRILVFSSEVVFLESVALLRTPYIITVSENFVHDRLHYQEQLDYQLTAEPQIHSIIYISDHFSIQSCGEGVLVSFN